MKIVSCRYLEKLGRFSAVVFQRVRAGGRNVGGRVPGYTTHLAD